MFVLDFGDIFENTENNCDFGGPLKFQPCPCLADIYGEFKFS